MTHASSCERASHHQVLYHASTNQESRSPLSFLRVYFLSQYIYKNCENCCVDLVSCLYSNIRAMEEKKGERERRKNREIVESSFNWTLFEKKKKEELKSCGSSRKKENFRENGRRYKMPGDEQFSRQNIRL